MNSRQQTLTPLLSPKIYSYSPKGTLIQVQYFISLHHTLLFRIVTGSKNSQATSTPLEAIVSGPTLGVWLCGDWPTAMLLKSPTFQGRVAASRLFVRIGLYSLEHLWESTSWLRAK